MRKPIITNEEAERLKAEFFARGGKVNVLPVNRVSRDSLIPETHKKRSLLDSLRERAKDSQNVG